MIKEQVTDLSFLKDDEIKLVLNKFSEANPSKNYVPAYHFNICDKDDKELGTCDLRVGYNDNIFYCGNIGYSVKEEYRGHNYAYKASKLVIELAKYLNMEEVYITCHPNNIPSKKTIEKLNCEFIGIYDVPKDNELYIRHGYEQVAIYKICLIL